MSIIRSLVKGALNTLPFNLKYEIFYQSARALDITGYQVSGNSGILIGPLRDQAVIREYLRRKSFSPEIVKLFSNFFAHRNGGTFFDLGANIGLITIPIAQNPDVHCISFEPDPINFDLLRANVAMNCRLDNIELVNAAVADSAGTMRFLESEYNCGDHRFADDGNLLVETVTLDRFRPPKLPLAVKIDCQGAEPLIIAGGAQTLLQADLVVCEFWPWGMRRMGNTPEPILALAEKFNCAYILHYEEAIGSPLTIQEATAKLQQVIDDGSEFAQADLILAQSPVL